MSAAENITTNVLGATLSRGKFVKGAGALAVVLALPAATAGSAAAANDLDVSQLGSWLTVNPDNTIEMRTGKYEFGQGSASAAYAQIVAEELNVPFSSITKIVMGDTDRTPDGGIGAGFLGTGATNMRKIAAYTYQALLDLASVQLGVPKGNLSVTNGVVSGGGRTTTYGDLVKNQKLTLTIQTTGTPLNGVSIPGTPPTKPTNQYTVVGTSQPMATIPPIVTGAATFVANIRLPNMLHARIVRPKTFGSTLVSVGKLDKKSWPSSQLFVKGNLVAVLSPSEWEAVGAASAVASKTKWSDWTALPGSGNLGKTLRERDYTTATRVTGQNRGNAGAALATAAKRMSASYLKPYQKHGPIGPSVAVADVKKNGPAVIWAHSQYPQHLRKMLAPILGMSTDDVIVRVLDGSGHYGRSNPGPDGAEADAAILSQALGRPVKVQWTRQEDMCWSTSCFPQLADIQVGLDASGNITAYQADFHQTGRYDGRGLGALLAGLPPGAMEDGNPRVPQVLGHYSWVASVSTQFPYEKIPNVLEIGHNSAPLGTIESPYNVGMRIHSMRTPVQREQTYAMEGMMNEVAASVGVDPIEYRLRHTADVRLTNVLNALKSAHGWQTRPSPAPGASTSGTKLLKGRGMGVFLRSQARWAAAADVTVDPKTGKVTIDKYTVVLDPGIVINPLLLRRNTEGGSVQGISEVMKEALTYDRGMITSVDWVKYPIVRFNDVPDVNVVLIHNPSVGAYNGAGEGSNGLPYVAIPAAVHDAIGKFPRTLPLRPANMRALLAS
jgi:CO/xanthine dehydrogenase Mo-binding subunit